MYPVSYLANLPDEVLFSLISQVDTPADLVNLPLVNESLNRALNCRAESVTTDSRFVNELNICQQTSQQAQFLAGLNAKFHLQMPSPVTWTKFVRAYKRSGYNSTCPEYATIFNCFKSAARSGLIEQFSPSQTDIPTLYDIFQQQEQILAQRLASYKDIPNPAPSERKFLDRQIRFAAIAYKYDQLELGDQLSANVKAGPYALFESPGERLIYYRLKAWARYVLLPFKVLSNSQIRQRYAEILFDPNVSDGQKRDIWNQKYRNPDLSQIQVKMENFPGDRLELVTVIFLKLGLKVKQYSHQPVLLLFAGQTGDPEVIRELQKEFTNPATGKLESRVVYEYTTYSMLQLVKKGYTENLNSNIFDAEVEVFGKKVTLAKLLSDFPLTELELLIQGILPKVKATIPSQLLLKSIEDQPLWTIVEGNNASAYLEYIRKYPNVRYTDLPTIATIKGLPIINDILDRLSKSMGLHGTSGDIRTWWNDNTKLLVNIWQVFGRRQFEDSLIYMQSKLVFDTDYRLSRIQVGRLLGITVKLGATDLLAYMFGFRLNKFTDQAEPLDNPGILMNPIDILEKYWQESYRWFYNLESPDLALDILDILQASGRAGAGQ